MTTRKLLGVYHLDMHQNDEAEWHFEKPSSSQFFPHPLFQTWSLPPFDHGRHGDFLQDLQTSRMGSHGGGETRARHQWSPRPVSRSGGSWHWHNLTRKGWPNKSSTEMLCFSGGVCFWGRSGKKLVGKGSAIRSINRFWYVKPLKLSMFHERHGVILSAVARNSKHHFGFPF